MNDISTRSQAPRPAASKPRQFWRFLLNLGQWLIERDQLPNGEDDARVSFSRPSSIGWMLKPDVLPDRMESPPAEVGFFRWLASRDRLRFVEDEQPHRRSSLQTLLEREELAAVPVQRTGSRGFFGWLIASERLPEEPAEPRRSTPSVFRWLMTSDPADRLENLQSTKEAQPHEP